MNALAAKLLAALLCALAALVLGMRLGMSWQSGRDDKTLTASRQDAERHRGEAQNLQSALDAVARQSAARLQQLQQQQRAAAAALSARDAQLHRIETLAQQRQGALQQAIHEDDDCKDMGMVPVCPAVAHRLWGTVSGRDTTASY